MTNGSATTSEQIVEIRYRPNAKVLDYRGTWAEMVAEYMGLTEWQIVENRFDVFDKARERRVFVSFRNAGVVLRNSPTRNYLPDQAGKFLRFLFDQKPFGDPLHVIRLGVRSKFSTSFEGEYGDLLRLYMDRYLRPTPEAREALSGEIIDIGGPINLKTPIGSVNTTSGPMPAEQSKEFFAFLESPPEVSLFLDVDFFQSPDKEVPGTDVISAVSRYAQENWDRHERFRKVVLG